MSQQHRQPGTVRLPRAIFASCMLAVTVTSISAATPRRFSVGGTPSVLSCGGIAAFCELSSLEGSIELDLEAGAVAVTGSDLYLRSRTNPAHPPTPFPQAGDLALTELVPTVFGTTIELRSPPGSFQTVLLRLFALGFDAGFDDDTIVLNGFYDEGCCDRFVLELGNVPLEEGEPGALRLELQSRRFSVTAAWRDFEGKPGVATAVPFDDRSGFFWFFRPDNPELVVKLIDACEPPFERVWVFAAGLTNVEVTLRVEDLASGEEKTYTSPLGTDYLPVLDTGAFPCSGPGG